MKASRSTHIFLAAALSTGLFAAPGFAQDPTDEVARQLRLDLA